MADESVELLRKWLNGEDEALSAWLDEPQMRPRTLAGGLLLIEGDVQRAAAEIVALLEEVRALRYGESGSSTREVTGSDGRKGLVP